MLQAGEPVKRTVVSIKDGEFLIDGKPTYEGREWRGLKLQGLLMNSRMVQGIFDDANEQTRAKWNYPDGPWDPERNTREFIAAMPEWRRHGLLSFTINLQGGSPEGYSKNQPWSNSAFEADGALKPAYMARLARVLDKANELGMVPIVGYFYHGQAHRLTDEPAVIRAAENATDWLVNSGHRNVMVEIANECNNQGFPRIVEPPRVQELIELVRKRSNGKLLVSVSMTGGRVPPANVIKASDFILLHGNGCKADRVAKMVDETRALPEFRGQPILFNEDDHFDFEKPENNFIAAVTHRAGWGYFDYRMKNEGFDEGYQSVPVNWGLSSERKRGFFKLLAEMTGSAPK